jgi:hypothetical protein
MSHCYKACLKHVSQNVSLLATKIRRIFQGQDVQTQDIGEENFIIYKGHPGLLGVKSSKTQEAGHMAREENRKMQILLQIALGFTGKIEEMGAHRT